MGTCLKESNFYPTTSIKVSFLFRISSFFCGTKAFKTRCCRIGGVACRDVEKMSRAQLGYTVNLVVIIGFVKTPTLIHLEIILKQLQARSLANA